MLRKFLLHDKKLESILRMKRRSGIERGGSLTKNFSRCEFYLIMEGVEKWFWIDAILYDS